MTYDVGGFDLGGFGTEDVVVFDDIVEYYVNLLIMQYHEKEKAQSHIRTLVTEAVAVELVSAVRDGFDVETAVGAQLDILAKYVGAQRTVYGLDLTHQYLSFPSYDDADPGSYPGFASYDDISIPDFFLSYDDSDRPIYAMLDTELRRLIQFRAALNSMFLSVGNIDDLLFEFFGTNVQMTDGGDMTMTYWHNPSDTNPLFTMVAGTNSLPKPAGVQIIVT